MSDAEVREIFARYEAILTGHFKLSSGRHSDTYLQCARVLEHPRVAHSLGAALANKLQARAERIDVVASPAMGGLLIGYAVAHALGCRFVFYERADGSFALRRGQQLSPGEKVVVIEDVITTGGSAAEVVELVRATGADVVGVGSIVDRSAARPPFGLESLLKVQAQSWEPDECPACGRGDAIDAPGSRHLKPGA
ncbi:MAG TPA: orotate phosphoribosyltransferase [Actinomycetota bacterium]|nr:orotate phosphoribosyltransferase [Actinomycetota bacterium]